MRRPAAPRNAPIYREAEPVAEPVSDPIAARKPLAAESPKACGTCISGIRCTVAHEARMNGPLSGPFFARLIRIWKKIGAGE